MMAGADLKTEDHFSVHTQYCRGRWGVFMDKGIVELESKLGLDEGFVDNLKSDDDWSFIIKLHALFEAACTHLLLFHFQEPDLADVFSRLDISAIPIGKLAILGKLNLLGEEDRRFIRSLSELRNSLVHDVRNHRYSLAAMIAEFNQDQIRKFAVSFSPYETRIRDLMEAPLFRAGVKESLAKQCALASVVDRARSDPKIHIWVGAQSVLITIVEMYGYSDYKQWIRAKMMFQDEE